MSMWLGLTGNMGMGKSRAAQEFAAHGWCIWDADARVHALYAQGGAATQDIARLAPRAVQEGAVDRAALKEEIAQKPDLLPQIENVVHALLDEDRRAFKEEHQDKNLVFDIPLLFENHLQEGFHATATVYVSEALQKERLLERGSMTEGEIAFYLGRQMPIEEKLKRSTYRIDGSSLEAMKRDVAHIMDQMKERQNA